MNFISASFLTKCIDCDGKQMMFQIWDTAGQERYRSLVPMYLRNADAAVIVYDVTETVSLLPVYLRNTIATVIVCDVTKMVRYRSLDDVSEERERSRHVYDVTETCLA